jgi:hypothetical protein
MRFPIKRSFVLILGCGALCLAFVGCSEKQKKQDSKKTKKFEPGDFVKYENNQIGFSIEKPKNLKAVAEGSDKVSFKAEGFPTVRVEFTKTKQKSGKGSGGGVFGDGYRWSVTVPLRKLRCLAEQVGNYGETIKKMCQSLKNTKSAPKNPAVKFAAVEISGKLKDGAAYKKALRDVRVKISKCWLKAVKSDAAFPAGSMNFDFRYKPDGTVKRSTVVNTFNYDKSKPLTQCVTEQFKSVKVEPAEKPVTIKWRMKFKLY